MPDSPPPPSLPATQPLLLHPSRFLCALSLSHPATGRVSGGGEGDGLAVPLIPPLQREIAADAAETPHTRR